MISSRDSTSSPGSPTGGGEAGCRHMWIMVEIFRPGHGAPRDKSHKENLIKMLHFHDNAEKVRIRRSSLC